MAPDPKVAEIARLKNRMLELEAQLKEAKKITIRLRDQYDKKDNQISIIDAEIAAEVERFRWRKEEMLFSLKCVDDESRDKIREMKDEEKSLLTDIADFDFVQYENERLNAKLKDAAAEQRSSSTTQLMERDRKKQKDFDTRMAMEETLRKTIKNVDDTYENEAISKMQMEASNAHKENEDILREYDLREKTTEELIKQQQRSYEQLMKIKIERDVVEISLKILDKNTKKLHEQNLFSTREVGIFREKLMLVEHEVESLRETLRRKDGLRTKAKVVVQRTHQLQSERDKNRHHVLHLCQRMMAETVQMASRLREQQSAALAKQLDDLSSTEGQSQDEGSTGGLSLQSTDELNLSSARLSRSRESTTEMVDPALYWQLAPKHILPRALQSRYTSAKPLHKTQVSTSMFG